MRSEQHTVQVIQVCHELQEPKTKQREYNGLIEAIERFNLSSGTIITLNEDRKDIITVGEKEYQITIAPIWLWLLS